MEIKKRNISVPFINSSFSIFQYTLKNLVTMLHLFQFLPAFYRVLKTLKETGRETNIERKKH